MCRTRTNKTLSFALDLYFIIQVIVSSCLSLFFFNIKFIKNFKIDYIFEIILKGQKLSAELLA